MFAHPGKKLLFMGCEIGQWNEWDCHHSLDWHLMQWDSHKKMMTLLQRLNRIYREVPAMHRVDFSWEGFEWVDFHDSDNSIVSFVRKGGDPGDVVIAIFNFTPVPRPGYRLGVPAPGQYEEFFNSDDGAFGGSHVLNAGPRDAEDVPWGSMKYSIPILVPPLGASFFRPVKKKAPSPLVPMVVSRPAPKVAG
jgi:1,4-alpha-glucan branching enzyme